MADARVRHSRAQLGGDLIAGTKNSRRASLIHPDEGVRVYVGLY